MAVDRLAGRTTIVATKVLSSAAGGPSPFHRIAEIHFPYMSVLQACAASEKAQETLASAVSISTGGPPIFIVAEEKASCSNFESSCLWRKALFLGRGRSLGTSRKPGALASKLLWSPRYLG
jgi:hypothetical protein